MKRVSLDDRGGAYSDPFHVQTQQQHELEAEAKRAKSGLESFEVDGVDDGERPYKQHRVAPAQAVTVKRAGDDMVVAGAGDVKRWKTVDADAPHHHAPMNDADDATRVATKRARPNGDSAADAADGGADEDPAFNEFLFWKL